MEIKKSKEANIERHRGTWLLMGFVVTLSFLFVSFEWAERDKVIDTSALIRDNYLEEVLLPVTFPEEKPTPPPPQKPIAEVIEIIDDKNNSEETPIASLEANDKPVDIGTYIPPAIEEDKPLEAEVFVIAETMPSFPGGQNALMSFMKQNIKYPTVPQEQGVEGRVIIQFIVDKDGTITDPVIARGVDPYLDKEAMRVIKAMPKWNPGKQRGTPVRVKYTVPVLFKLQK